eukprot:TRINITY_DN4196_c0_g3_i1.p1 TRINITY_DN4196_c0_g3~~TRINITY_DN4196_c0_g3_i1.p1  ORF type:complete len:271 (+),score=41.04 TRINITY_DN4196_c0_g3_i1:20-832(+)
MSAAADGELWNETAADVEEPEEFSSEEFLKKVLDFFHELDQPVRVGFFGTQGSGKSSLITTIANALSPSVQVRIDMSVASARACNNLRVTKRVKDYSIREQLILVDTPGFSQHDHKEMPFEKVLDGVIRDGMSLSKDVGPTRRIAPMHAVVLVVDCMDVLGEDWDWIKEQLNDLIFLLVDKDVVPFIALNKCDRLQRGLRGDLANVFRYGVVQDRIARLSLDTGLPVNQILPTKAYHCECTRKPNVERLALFCLKEAIEANTHNLQQTSS